jgi:hypothetical protein
MQCAGKNSNAPQRSTVTKVQRKQGQTKRRLKIVTERDVNKRKENMNRKEIVGETYFAEHLVPLDGDEVPLLIKVHGR